jgi:hypothetical protein
MDVTSSLGLGDFEAVGHAVASARFEYSTSDRR